MLTTGLVRDGIIALVQFASAIVLDGSVALPYTRPLATENILTNPKTGGHSGTFLARNACQCLIYVFSFSSAE